MAVTQVYPTTGLSSGMEYQDQGEAVRNVHTLVFSLAILIRPKGKRLDHSAQLPR